MAQEAVSEEQSMSPYPCGMMTAPHTVVSNSGERDILSVCQVTGLVSVFGFFVCFSSQGYAEKYCLEKFKKKFICLSTQ